MCSSFDFPYLLLPPDRCNSVSNIVYPLTISYRLEQQQQLGAHGSEAVSAA